MAIAIRRLTIKRYRSLRDFTWTPHSGVNVFVGPADGGKSNVLAAISLLLAPSAQGARSEFDYFERRVADGFEIEALLSGLDATTLSTDRRLPPLFGLKEDGSLEMLPSAGTEPVLKIRVAGTADLEAVHEIVAPSGDPFPFSVALRKKLGLVRVLDDDTASRALRVSQTSLLGRQFDAAALRGAAQGALAAASAGLTLPQAATDTIEDLRTLFKAVGLPDDIMIGLGSPHGADLLQLLDILRGVDRQTAIPIALSGNGTKALLAVSLISRSAPNLVVLTFDEPERGLEPFRQRIAAAAIAELGARGQAFIATHSPTMLRAFSASAVWRLDASKNPILFSPTVFARLLRQDPEAFFAPLPIVCEGVTEIGLLRAILPSLTGSSLEALGIHPVDGGGHGPTLDLAKGLADAGIRVAVFADNETELEGTRAKVAAVATSFFWASVKNIEEAVARYVPMAQMGHVLAAARMEERYLMDQLKEALPTLAEPVKSEWEAIAKSFDEQTLRDALARVMNELSWFKTAEHGERLGRALLEIGIPREMQDELQPFADRLKA